MKLYFIIVYLQHIIFVAGPLSYSLDECNRHSMRIEHRMEPTQYAFPDSVIDTVHPNVESEVGNSHCILRANRPKLQELYTE